MQVTLRLQRFGSKKRPFYRMVAAPKTKKRDGRFLDIIGLYHPIMPEDKQLRLDKDKILEWLGKGAQPSPQVKRILVQEKMWQDFGIAKEQRRVARVKKVNVKRKAKVGKVSNANVATETSSTTTNKDDAQASS